LSYSPWWIDRGDGLETCKVKGRRQGKHVLARLEGVEDRDAAEQLAGCRLYIRQQQLPELADGEYYWSDLIGLDVETLQAEPLGRVAAMMETGADDVMVLEGERERLIPFVIDDIVREVDFGNRRLVVDWSPDY
jgi:16S rRNA processing protein RimM